ncbi:MAG: glycosyltransferase family 2 protein [Lachnospiraceae bacterium]|nr:glycosyltransferase family 2 protein [Lachnospiraceae bacterium]
MSEKISIIIPVYKVEAYLAECVDSILKQTYQNLEIILVDDGSPDKCGEICDEYAQKDNRIRVIHKANAGVARARNDGIEVATGDYISFIDSDDWIAENAYELLYKGLKEHDADCAVGGCVTIIDKDGVLTPQEGKRRAVGCISAQEAMKGVLLNGSAVWNRLFKREVFKEVRFPLDRINDDEVVALHAYAECEKIVFLDADTYFYRIRSNSITTSKFSIRKVDCYYNSAENLEFVRMVCPELVPCGEFKFIKAMLYSYVNLNRMKKDEQVKEVLKRIKADIKANKSLALKNQYVTLPMKVLMMLAAI